MLTESAFGKQPYINVEIILKLIFGVQEREYIKPPAQERKMLIKQQPSQSQIQAKEWHKKIVNL